MPARKETRSGHDQPESRPSVNGCQRENAEIVASGADGMVADGMVDASDDLLWLAFLYASNELSADEAERFEARLADDQRAREALAQAVELGASLALACGQCQHVPATTLAKKVAQRDAGRNHRAHWVAWAAAAVAASVLVAMTFGPWGSSGQRSPEAGNESAEIAAQGELALVWVASADVLGIVGKEEHFDEVGLPNQSDPSDDSDATETGDDALESTSDPDTADEVEVPNYYSLMAEIDALSQPPVQPGEEPRES